MRTIETVIKEGNYILECDIKEVHLDEHDRPYYRLHGAKIMLSKRVV